MCVCVGEGVCACVSDLVWYSRGEQRSPDCRYRYRCVGAFASLSFRHEAQKLNILPIPSYRAVFVPKLIILIKCLIDVLLFKVLF